MRLDPVRQGLRPGGFSIGEARRPEDGDKDLRPPRLAGQPVDHHRHRITRIVDEQLLAGCVGLTHRHRQPGFPGAVKLAEPAVAVSVRMLGDVFIPHDRQRHVLALQFAPDGGPVRLLRPPMTQLLACRATKQAALDFCFRQRQRRQPVETDRVKAAQRQPHRRSRNPYPYPNLAGRQPCHPQPNDIAHIAHRYPLHWHSSLPCRSQRDRT